MIQRTISYTDLNCTAAHGTCQSILRFARRTLLAAVLVLVPLHFAHGQAQTSALPPAPFPPGALYELGFSPGGTAFAVVVHAIQSARSTLLVACYELTSRPIADSLLAAQARGVHVAIVADAKESRQRYSLIPLLEQHRIPVRRNANYNEMHHKFLCLDNSGVETGSFNFSRNASEHNAENALFLLNVPDIAVRFAQEWQRLWDESQ